MDELGVEQRILMKWKKINSELDVGISSADNDGEDPVTGCLQVRCVVYVGSTSGPL